MTTYQGSCIECGHSHGHGFLDCPFRADRIKNLAKQRDALNQQLRDLMEFDLANESCPTCTGGRIRDGEELRQCPVCQGETVVQKGSVQVDEDEVA